MTVENLRTFDYRTETDYTERWEMRTYDLDTLQGVDMFLFFWGPTLIAHTITSWDFGGGQHLAVSIETRKEKGESYSAVRGFFRQYELYYVVADERDRGPPADEISRRAGVPLPDTHEHGACACPAPRLPEGSEPPGGTPSLVQCPDSQLYHHDPLPR